MQRLSMGGNATLSSTRFDLIVDWPAQNGALDTSAYMLEASGRVRGDADMIFYNQLSAPSGCLRINKIDPLSTCFAVDLHLVPDAIERIVICATVEEPGRTMASFRGVGARIVINGEATLGFFPELENATEVAMQLVEIYRRNGTWKLRAIGQGFNAGLGALAASFGIDVAENEPTTLTAEQTGSTVDESKVDYQDKAAPKFPEPTPVTAASTTSNATPVLNSLNPILEIPIRQSTSLGILTARLAWSEEFGAAIWRARPLELAIGALYRMRNGTEGVVQHCDFAGAYDRAPFIQVLPDERIPGNRQLNMRINSDGADELSQCVIFVYIVNGAANWRAREINFSLILSHELNIDIPQDGDGNAVMAVASIDFTSEQLKVTRLAEFFPTHRNLGKKLGWNIGWKEAENNN